MTRIDAIYVGGIRPLPPEGHPSGIFKEAVAGPILLGPEGLQGDAQADRRVHGGPYKALHHYAAENYARLAAAFPAKAALFVPGIWRYSLVDPWETHYGEVARTMLADHDYLTTHSVKLKG